MIHPILNKKVYLLAYVLIWLIFSLIQMSILLYFFHLPLFHSFMDGLTANIIRGTIGLVIWYPVRFSPVGNKTYMNALVNIVATGIFTVSVWSGTTWFFLKGIFSQNVSYLSFLENSLPYRIITDALIYIVLVLGYSLIIYSINLKQKISDEANLKALVREAELNALKSQINPHFLFNSLNSLSMLTKKDPSRAREMVIKLSEFLRYSLRFTTEDFSTLGEEINNMNRYLEIEKIRFGEKLIFKQEVDESLLERELPNMLLQPLFENAVKHGVYESTEPITISFSAGKMESMLQLDIRNDYDPEAGGRKGAGIGLKNIGERLRLVYGRNDLLRYQADGDVFHVKVLIPEPPKV